MHKSAVSEVAIVECSQQVREHGEPCVEQEEFCFQEECQQRSRSAKQVRESSVFEEIVKRFSVQP